MWAEPSPRDSLQGSQAADPGLRTSWSWEYAKPATVGLCSKSFCWGGELLFLLAYEEGEVGSGIQVIALGVEQRKRLRSLGPPLFTDLCSFLGTGQGTTRHKLVHELKDETSLLFHRKLYKLVIKTSMGS